MSRREDMKKKLEDGNPEFETALEKGFAEIDLDKNGYIDKVEFGKAAQDIIQLLGGPGSVQEKINSQFAKYDKNHDQKISKDEFRVMLREIILSLLDVLYPD